MAEPFNYRIAVEWSAEDDAFVARVPALPGCAAHGRTPESATREAVVGARGILESMRAHGAALPVSDLTAGHSGQLRLRLPRSLHEQLSRMAALDGVSLNQELVTLLASRAGARPETSRGTKASLTSSRALDSRHKDENGEIRRQSGNTLVRTLRREYGEDFAQGYRSDTRLEDLLEREKASSLSELLRRKR
jgi:predicted RNase H-like HicB family nuclease